MKNGEAAMQALTFLLDSGLAEVLIRKHPRVRKATRRLVDEIDRFRHEEARRLIDRGLEDLDLLEGEGGRP